MAARADRAELQRLAGQLNRLAGQLPAGPVATVVASVRRAMDPMVAVLDAAPWDDEPLSETERCQVAASARAIARGERLLTTAEVAAEIGAAAP